MTRPAWSYRMPEQTASPDRNMVFLFCSERCGSNLISSMMGAHPEIHSPPPYHLGRDMVLNMHNTLGVMQNQQTRQVIKQRLLKNIGRTNSEEAAQALASWLEQRPDASVTDIARFIYKDLDSKPGHDTVFVKENNLHKVLFFVLQCFPDAKFVFQVRDPRDFMASAKARRNHWLGNKFGSDRNALAIWHEDQLGALTAMACLGPDRVFFQRYEDLVSNPQAVLSQLCNFLGKRFDETMLSFHQSKSATRLAGSVSARENLSKPLMSGNFGKYRDSLSRRSIRMVETHVGDLMDRFGYERDFPRTAKPSKRDILSLQFREPIEMYINGQRQPFYSAISASYQRQLVAEAAPLIPRYLVDANNT